MLPEAACRGAAKQEQGQGNGGPQPHSEPGRVPGSGEDAARTWAREGEGSGVGAGGGGDSLNIAVLARLDEIEKASVARRADSNLTTPAS